MEAILLVGGLGTRLRPLTDDLPKPMLPVAGVPLVVHQIARARSAGVDHVVLATSYRARVFTDLLGDGSSLGVRVDYAVEDEPLGTGGAIRNAAAYLGQDPVLVFNGDVIDGHDIAAQVGLHVDRRADATLYLTTVDDARAYGCVPTDGAGRVTAFHEKMPEPVSDQINAGCYVLERAVIDDIPAGRPVSVERETFPGLLADGHLVQGVVDGAYWRDLGTPEAYIQGCADVVLGLVDAPARPGPAGESLVLDGADVSASAVLRGGTCVGPGCVVGDAARVDGSVLLDGASVESGAVVRASAVGRGARVGAGAVLDGVIVADGVQVPAHARPAAGSRLTAR
ncbi:MAG: sugar phosphate nucleotidyltransferase [Jiangellaceae bacterium]